MDDVERAAIEAAINDCGSLFDHTMMDERKLAAALAAVVRLLRAEREALPPGWVATRWEKDGVGTVWDDGPGDVSWAAAGDSDDRGHSYESVGVAMAAAEAAREAGGG